MPGSYPPHGPARNASDVAPDVGFAPSAIPAAHPPSAPVGPVARTVGPGAGPSRPAPRARANADEGGGACYMLSMTAFANPLVGTSVAPSVWRAKS